MDYKDIPFFTPFIDDNDINHITKSLKNTTNISTKDIENKIKELFEVQYCVALPNISFAIKIALEVYDTKRGDEVMMSVSSPVVLPQAVRHLDCKPVLIDTLPDNYNMDIDKFEIYLKEHYHKKIKILLMMIMPDSLPDLDRLIKIYKTFNINLVTIAINMISQKYKDEYILANQVGISITTINKQLSNKKLANISFMTTSCETTAKKLHVQKASGLPLVYHNDDGLDYLYDVETIGHDFDIDTLSIIFNLTQLDKYEAYVQKRVEIAKIYCEKLQGLKHVSVKKFDENSVYSEFIVQVDKNRDAFAKELKTKGITTGLHYIPLHLLSYYKEKYNYKITQYPNALTSFAKILSLPIYENLSYSQVDFICEQIIKLDAKWI